jgi:hypothetical protein
VVLLHEILDFEPVQNYHGPWIEWENLMYTPIETGKAEWATDRQVIVLRGLNYIFAH